MADQLKLDDLQSYGELFPSNERSEVKGEQRQSFRKLLEVEGMLMLDGVSIDLKTVDISLGGLCIRSKKQLPVGKDCQVSFPLALSCTAQSVAALVQVIYCFYTSEQDYKVGLEFLRIAANGTDEIRQFVDTGCSHPASNPD